MKALLVGVLILAACGSKGDTSPASTLCGADDEVHYHVTGNVETVDLTVLDNTGTQQKRVDLPLTNQGGTEGILVCTNRRVSLSAQIDGVYEGTITCAIDRNTRPVSENTSSGKYAVVSCVG